MNIFTKNYQALKQLLVYQPPANPPLFVLPEAEKPGAQPAGKDRLSTAMSLYAAQIRYARRLLTALEKAGTLLTAPFAADQLAAIKAELAALTKQKSALSPLTAAYTLATDPREQAVSTSLEENKLTLQAIYSLPANSDLVFRAVIIPASPPVAASLIFIEGLADKRDISISILQPLMLFGNEDRKLLQGDLVELIIKKYLPGNKVRLVATMRDVTESVNLGDTALFLDGAAQAVIVETKGHEHRGVGRPLAEPSVRGSQSAFTETLRVNTGLVRSHLRTSDLITEMLTLGLRSNTPCALMYLKSVANPDLVREARRRLANIRVDSLNVASTLELLIEDHPLLPFPQALATERPDRVAAALAEGRLAILLDGSSTAIVLPITLFTLLHSGEDFAYSWLVASFLRLLRVGGAFMTIMLPSFYIAISYFHQEALPTDLVLAIAASRERVPFPSFLEIASMEFAFELVREAGVRIPSMLGPTIGIVGAITLGQAGIAAGIVSPLTVVVIAVTGLASFVMPDYALGASIRLTRFSLEVVAALLGLVGVAGALILLLVILASMKSLGVPYMAPVAPKTTAGYDIVLRGPVLSQEKRPDELSPQAVRRQAPVSRAWIRGPSGEKEDEQ